MKCKSVFLIEENSHVQGVESSEHCVGTMSISTQLIHGGLVLRAGDLNHVC